MSDTGQLGVSPFPEAHFTEIQFSFFILYGEMWFSIDHNKKKIPPSLGAKYEC